MDKIHTLHQKELVFLTNPKGQQRTGKEPKYNIITTTSIRLEKKGLGNLLWGNTKFSVKQAGYFLLAPSIHSIPIEAYKPVAIQWQERSQHTSN